MQYNHGMWNLGTSGCSYLDSVAVNHSERDTIDTWQKAKKYFSRWHKGSFLLIWDGRRTGGRPLSAKEAMQLWEQYKQEQKERANNE